MMMNNEYSTANTATIHEKLEELYQSTSWTVNTCESYEMDQMLKALRSPAHQSFFVLQHALRNYHYYDDDSAPSSIEYALSNYCHHLLKPDYCFIIKVDAGSSDHSTEDSNASGTASRLFPGVVYNTLPKRQTEIPIGWKLLDQTKKSPSTKKLVDMIVSIANSTTSTSFLHDHELKEREEGPLFHQLHSLYLHLLFTLGTDLRNGAAADVAFSLSLIGIQGRLANDILHILAHMTALELERKSTRARRASDILQIVEKLAASGIDGEYAQQAYRAAAQSLIGSQEFDKISSDALEELQSGQLNLCSPRPLLWLWRRMSLFHKVSTKDLESSMSLETLQSSQFANLSKLFEDPTLPLVIDVGCGLGVPLVGLAAQKATHQNPSHKYQLDGLIDWTRCNYLGGELSSHAVRWATAMASRWNLMNRLRFLHISTETILDYLLVQQEKEHQCCVALILLQFPTPYRLKGDGNARLPTSPTDDTFMANPFILQRIVDLLNRSSHQQGKTTYVLVQSNCEDVALYIHETLTSMGLRAMESTSPQTLEMLTSEASSRSQSERTKTWLEQSETVTRRAAGDDWSSQPLLPVATETEAACEWQGTAIHRCLFQTTDTICTT